MSAELEAVQSLYWNATLKASFLPYIDTDTAPSGAITCNQYGIVKSSGPKAAPDLPLHLSASTTLTGYLP